MTDHPNNVIERELERAWVDFLDANPDDLNSPEELPDHALMTCKQFAQYAGYALEASHHAELVEALRNVVDRKSATFKARNGRDVGIQGDDGERCWIVHSDEMARLESLLAKIGGAA